MPNRAGRVRRGRRVELAMGSREVEDWAREQVRVWSEASIGDLDQVIRAYEWILATLQGVRQQRIVALRAQARLAPRVRWGLDARGPDAEGPDEDVPRRGGA